MTRYEPEYDEPQDSDEFEELDNICNACMGTGEGKHGDAPCSDCRGSGTNKKNDFDYDPDYFD